MVKTLGGQNSLYRSRLASFEIKTLRDEVPGSTVVISSEYRDAVLTRVEAYHGAYLRDCTPPSRFRNCFYQNGIAPSG